MNNWFCYMELTTDDLDASDEFYSQLFDWKMSDMPGAQIPYRMIDTGQEPAGGMMKLPMPDVPKAWTMYVEVEDLDASLLQVVELGGKVLMGKSPVPEQGWFGLVQDPQGAVLGLWETKKAEA